MALVTVYSPDGIEANVESVDAREYVKHCGYTHTKPVSEVVEVPVVEVPVVTAKAAKAAKAEAVPAAPWTPQA